MNIDDIKEKIEIPGTRLGIIEAIFWKQHELANKYIEIEEKNGVGYGLVSKGYIDINDVKSQSLIKDFAWRVTEELTEAIEAYDNKQEEHMLEEIADAFHFMVELCIITNITPKLVATIDPLGPQPLSPKPKRRAYSVIHELGLAMNCLKQKPWKQTHVLTDSKKFTVHLITAFLKMCELWLSLGGTAETLYVYYFKKNKVNQFRIESQY